MNVYFRRQIIWENCGVLKSKDLLNNGLEKIRIIQTKAKDIDIRIDEHSCEELALIFDLQSSLISAEATILSALERNESRGSHQRSDFKETDPSFAFNCLIQMDLTSQKLKVSKSPLKKLTKPLQNFVNGARREVNFKNKLLE